MFRIEREKEARLSLLARDIANGSTSLPAALAEAWEAGQDYERTIQAQMRAAEVRPRARCRSDGTKVGDATCGCGEHGAKMRFRRRSGGRPR